MSSLCCTPQETRAEEVGSGGPILVGKQTNDLTNWDNNPKGMNGSIDRCLKDTRSKSKKEIMKTFLKYALTLWVFNRHLRAIHNNLHFHSISLTLYITLHFVFQSN